MVKAVEMLFSEIILPISKLGYFVEIPAVCGNHDRSSPDKPMNKPGVESLTYVLYKMLEMLCQVSGLKNVVFNIPTMSTCTVDIFGKTALYTHGDRGGIKLTRADTNKFINDKQSLFGKVIHYLRFAHLHDYHVLGRGRSICNGTLVTDDGFAQELGFTSEAGQTINCYVRTSKRKTDFYWSYLASVEGIQ
jgi:hypothetical protein